MDGNTMAELNRPLLSGDMNDSNESTAVTELPSWPAEAAARTQLLVPKEYQASTGTNAPCCVLRLDAAQRLLKVVAISSDGQVSTDDDEEQVLDVIDVDDMIGAQLQIDLVGNNANGNQGATNTTPPVPGRAANEPSRDMPIDRQGRAVLNIYSYPRHNPAHDSWLSLWCGGGPSSRRPPPNPPSYQRLPAEKLKERVAHHRSFTLKPTEDFADVQLVLQGLRRLATGYVTERNVLVLVSPVSGPRKDGPVVYERTVRPILEQANITTESLVTTHAGHARERMAMSDRDDVTSYDGLIIIGGDGLLSEVVNGLMERPDADTVLKRVKIGLVGCGTANGVAASLAKHAKEVDDLMTNLFMIAKSRTITIDLSVHQTQNSTVYGFLSYTYGAAADIDIKSEVLRWMGSLRYDVWGALTVLRMPRHRARFTYLPPDKVPRHRTQAVGVMPATVTERIPEDSVEWITMEEDFLLFWPSQLSHVAKRTHLSPDSLVQDGLYKVVMIRGKVSRLRFALILLGMETGTHLSYNGIEVLDCCAYRLEPITPGLSVLDGEVLEEGPIQAKVLPAALQVFCHAPIS